MWSGEGAQKGPVTLLLHSVAAVGMKLDHQFCLFADGVLKMDILRDPYQTLRPKALAAFGQFRTLRG
eukprot:7531597-Alexandrium_andersonii.AAC.1